MADSRLDKLEARIATAKRQDNWERVVELTQDFAKLLKRGECPRCLSTDLELTPEPISCPGGKVQRVCITCYQEIKARENGWAPVYTKGGMR